MFQVRQSKNGESPLLRSGCSTPCTIEHQCVAEFGTRSFVRSMNAIQTCTKALLYPMMFLRACANMIRHDFSSLCVPVAPSS